MKTKIPTRCTAKIPESETNLMKSTYTLDRPTSSSDRRISGTLDFGAILSKFPDAKKSGEGFIAKCPAHEDRSPSLSIKQGADGKTLLHCHADCTVDAICEAIKITVSDLFPKPERLAPKIIATYDYTGADGKLLSQVCRYDPKDFRQRRPDGKGGWIWKGGIEQVPFHLPALIQAVSENRTVFICEGEKDVLAVEQAGFAATCNAGGAGKWRDDFAQYFGGANIVIIADKDEPGRKHARKVAESLHPVAGSVRVLELPDVGGHKVKDAADYLSAGGAPADLDEFAQNAPFWNLESSEPKPIGRALGEFQNHRLEDPNELLKHRYLCRGAGMLFCGPTGIGKSTFTVQSLVQWALGCEAFGLMPARPIRSLLIQAENDEGDIAEMRDGIFHGLNLGPGQREQAAKNIIVLREDSKTGMEFFCDTVKPALQSHKPDLLIVDPALAYIGGESNSQKDVGGFLRNGLNPLLREFGCGCIVVHHTNKPPTGKEKSAWAAGDFAYLGAGSAEWANWARAVLSIRSIGSHDIFELNAGKRGSRLDWKDKDGGKVFSKPIAHSKEPGVICWCEADPNEVEQGGRPASYGADDLLDVLPEGGLTTTDWLKEASSECGIKASRFYQLIRVLEKEGRTIKSKASKKWQPILK